MLGRKPIKLNLNPDNLSPLDRLCFVGSHGMGLLSYEPENSREATLPHQDLGEIHGEIQSFQEQDDDKFIDDLISLTPTMDKG